MANRFIATDGAKSLDMLTSNDPAIWTYFSNAPQSSKAVLYAYVAAVYRAYNLTADTIGSIPFSLIDMKTKKEYDSSASWENKVGFMKNPNELFRLDTLSYIDSNSVYNLRTTDILGYKTKDLVFAVPTTFTPYVSPSTGQLEYIERNVGTEREIFAVDDPRLIRMWRKDHTTEVLPSPNTIAAAIQNSAEQVLYTDSWIKHYYKRGGIKPTLIAMKGLVIGDKKNEEEKNWTNWLKGIGRYIGNIARVYNAEAMDVKAFGDGVAELKDNTVYQSALANIAMGVGMPLSLLLANSANYATAETEQGQWYKTFITPLCNWLAYGYNEQVFHPMGLHLMFKTESVDENQDEEKLRIESGKLWNEFIASCASYEIMLGIANTTGIEISDDLMEAAKKYFADKEKKTEPPVVVQSQPVQQLTQIEPQPVKWIPNVNELQEMKVWCGVAIRKFNKQDDMDFDYAPHYGGLPDNVTKNIKLGLVFCKSTDEIKSLFDINQYVQDVKQNDAASVLEGIRLALTKL